MGGWRKLVLSLGISVWVAVAAVLAALWLWFLARGRAAPGLKRLALRVTLLGLAFALVGSAARRGVLSHASFGFRVALVLAVAIVTVGYLYLTRFCWHLRPDGAQPQGGDVPAVRRSIARSRNDRAVRSPVDERVSGPARRQGRPDRARGSPEGPSA